MKDCAKVIRLAALKPAALSLDGEGLYLVVDYHTHAARKPGVGRIEKALDPRRTPRDAQESERAHKCVRIGLGHRPLVLGPARRLRLAGKDDHTPVGDKSRLHIARAQPTE